MSVMRVHKSKNFTVMSNYHFREKGMSLKAKGLLSLMLSLPDDWNYSVNGLVTLSKDGKDSVMSALSELESFGYLKRTRLTNSKGQFQGVEYDIYEQPQPQTPVSEEQNEGIQHEGKSHADNPSQLNTKLTKNLKDINTNGENTNETDEFESILANSIVNESLRELYRDYIEMRESIKSPLTAKGLEALMQRAHRLSDGNIDKQKIMIEAAIINNWKNVYSPNERTTARDNQLWKELHDIYGMD